jgi:hypothetical protein
MSFTRYNDDPIRITKRLQISTNEGRYYLNTPGWGDKPNYINDPHIRLQGWGANYLNNAIGIENDLHGLTRKTGHDEIESNNYLKHSAYDYTNTKSYPVNNDILVEESRAILPGFLFRDAEMYRWEKPLLDPQANIEIPFNYEMSSRIIVKDNYTQQHLANMY